MRKRLVLILLLLAGLATAWQAETRATLKQRLILRSLTSQLALHGALSYTEASAHFWGSGEITELRFVPGDALRARYALPADAEFHIPSLRYRDWQDGEQWPETVRFRFDTATLPLVEPWPKIYSGTLDWTYGADNSLNVASTLQAERAGRIETTLALRLAAPASFDEAILRKAGLHYRDLGFAQTQRAVLAQRLGADTQSADGALADLIAKWLLERGLPLATEQRQALGQFASAPTALTIRLDPPGELRPGTLSLFTPVDRVAAVGLSIEAR